MEHADAEVAVTPVAMAGGSGTRLWPLSRTGYPKQFLALAGATSLFQQAVERLDGLAGAGLDVAPPLIVGSEQHRFLVLERLREVGVGPQALLLERAARNTAPALTLAALQARTEGADPLLLAAPADHTFADSAAFTSATRDVVRLAADGGIVVPGVVPTRAETGYGCGRLGWTPKIGLRELVRAMVHADHESARRDSRVKRAGFKAFNCHE